MASGREVREEPLERLQIVRRGAGHRRTARRLPCPRAVGSYRGSPSERVEPEDPARAGLDAPHGGGQQRRARRGRARRSSTTTTVRESTSSSRWRATKAARHSPMRVPPDQSGTRPASRSQRRSAAVPPRARSVSRTSSVLKANTSVALRHPLQREREREQEARVGIHRAARVAEQHQPRRPRPAASRRASETSSPAGRRPPGAGFGGDRGGRARARARAGGSGAWRAARPAGSPAAPGAASSRSSHSSNGFFRRSASWL